MYKDIKTVNGTSERMQVVVKSFEPFKQTTIHEQIYHR